MPKRPLLYRTLVAGLAAVLLAPPVAAYRGTIVCESNGYRYNRCNVDTEGRVEFRREISTGNLCRQGRSWGWDGGGIWVDRGCRAEFTYGRGHGGGHDNNSAAIAAGVIGALALGAIVANQNPGGPGYPPPPVYAPPPPATAVPPWAVGSFIGYDSVVGQQVQLAIGGRGRVFLRDWNGRVVNEGVLRDGVVHWSNGRRSFLAQERSGVVLGDIDGANRYRFRRS